MVAIMLHLKCFPFQQHGSGGHKVCSRQIGWGVWEQTQRQDGSNLMSGQEGDPEVCSFPAVYGPWVHFSFPVELFGISLCATWIKISAALGATRRRLGQDAGLSNPPHTSAAESGLKETLVGRRTWRPLAQMSLAMWQITCAKERLWIQLTLLCCSAVTTISTFTLVHTNSFQE